jgi:hypothetical protein
MTWILRTVALAMLILAFLPRGGGSAARMVVISIEGVRLETVLRGVAQGDLPLLAALIEGGVYGVFSSDGAVRSTLEDLITVTPRFPSRDTRRSRFLWDPVSSDGAERIVVGFGPGPAVRSATVLQLPGPNPETGFLGPNTGRIENLRELEQVPVPWPYSEAGPSLAARAAQLDLGESSDWIEIQVPYKESSRSGVFRLRRLDDDVAWLSPIFTRTVGGKAEDFSELGDIVYVPDSATWAVKSSRLEDYFYDHVRDVTASRLDAATILAGSPNWSLLVYVDDLLASVTYAYGDEADASAGRIVDQGYEVVDQRLADLLAAAGEVVVVVIGFPGATDSSSPETSENWYLVAGDHGQSIRVDTSSAELAATLRYLVGAQGDGVFSAADPVHAIVARYWRRSQSRSTVAVSLPAPEVPLTVESLKNLGALAPPDA